VAEGSEQWSVFVGFEPEGVDVDDGGVYVTGGTTVLALDGGDGAEQWRYGLTEDTDTGPTVADGTVYASAGTEHTVALSAEDGTEQWRYEETFTLEAPPTVADGTVYAPGGGDPYVGPVGPLLAPVVRGQRVDHAGPAGDDDTVAHHDGL